MLLLNKMQLYFEQKEIPKWGDAMYQLSLYPLLGNISDTDLANINIVPYSWHIATPERVFWKLNTKL